ILWHAGIEFANRNRRFLEDLLERVHGARRLEGRSPDQQRVERRAQRIHVRRWPDFAVARRYLFGRHKTGRAKYLAGGREAAFIADLLGEAEVGHARLAVGIDENVRRL